MRDKIVLLFFLAVFTAAGFCGDARAAYIDLEEVSIPKGYGTIKEVYQTPKASGKGGRIIFHIQDVHANYEAQKSLANILEYFIKTYGLEVILVEGGITDKDFSYIREWAPLEERKRKADKLMREGTITGETYVDIASDFPLKFQGIEDKELYEKSMDIYLKVEKFRDEALELMSALNRVSEKLKKYIYTSRLKNFDKIKREYRDEKIELADYMKELDSLAKKEKVDLSSFANHIALIKTASMEDDLDFDKVEKERDKLVEQLSASMPRDALNELISKSVTFKEEKIAALEFYSYLYEAAKKADVDLNEYKRFRRYLEYLEVYEELDEEELFYEISKVEDAVSGALCKNDEQKTLFGISKNIFILEDLLRLKLNPEDYAHYRDARGDFQLDEWVSFLKRHTKRFRIEMDIPGDLSVFTKNSSVMESFFDTSFERDEAFVRNSIKKMEKENARLAVLIAGGFHTKNLTRLLKANDFSYLVITPALTEKTDHKLYDKILKESYETRLWAE
jgi:hypothetical protein